MSDSKTCPICGHSQNQTINDCTQCGWDFPVLLGSGEAISLALNERLAEAKQKWQGNRYHLGIEPALERDPFETWDEFAERLAARYWCAGDVMLVKAKYDIEKSRFDIEFNLKFWCRHLVLKGTQYFLSLSRDEARALNQKGMTWPLYFELVLFQQQVSVRRMVLFTGKQEIEVASEVFVGQLGNEKRYIDHCDGTITDTQTGLMWMKPSLGQQWQHGHVVGEAKKFTWDEACQQTGYCFAGYKDWRLPTIDELKTLVYCSTGRRDAFGNYGLGGKCLGDFQVPTIDLAAFPKTIADGDLNFWTSSSLHIGDAPDSHIPILTWIKSLFLSPSPFPGYSINAMEVNFSRGHVGYEFKLGKLLVRLVRAGQ